MIGVITRLSVLLYKSIPNMKPTGADARNWPSLKRYMTRISITPDSRAIIRSCRNKDAPRALFLNRSPCAPSRSGLFIFASLRCNLSQLTRPHSDGKIAKISYTAPIINPQTNDAANNRASPACDSSISRICGREHFYCPHAFYRNS